MQTYRDIVIMDNLSAHKVDGVTPTGASWPNQVERFFAMFTEKQLRRGVHRSTQELEQAIRDYIDTVNANPRPFRWAKTADDILATIKRLCRRTLDVARRQQERVGTSGHDASCVGGTGSGHRACAP